MATNENTDVDEPALNRRRLLQGMAATGIAASAGCLGGGDDGQEADPSEAFEPEDVNLEDVKVGGTLNFALSRQSVGNFDTAESTQADDSTLFNLIYDGLRTTDPQGQDFNWMADEFEVAEANDVTAPDDYLDYMAEYEIASVDSETGTAAFDLGDNNVALLRHPDDVAQVGGELGEGDMMRLLTREESGAAVDDGVFGTQVTATLHEGIEFTNGEELTAEHVVRSYDRLVGSTNQGQQFGESFLHARVDPDDEYTVHMYAREPDADADGGVQPFSIYPEEHWDVPAGDLDPRGGGPTPIGTGPYKIETVEEGRQLLLTKNENYWLENIGLGNKDWWDGDGSGDFPESPVIEEINIRFQPESGQRVGALQEGSVDMAYDLPAEDQTTFQQSDQYEDYSVSAAKSTGFLFMQMPLVENGGALHNQGVRQAIQKMIPREQIVETIEDGWATPATLPFPQPAAGPGTASDYQDLLENADYAYPSEAKPDEAASLVEESGASTPIDLTLETNADDSARQDKISLIIGELENTDAFTAEMETPADLNPWFLQDLIAANAPQTYAERNATATLGLGAGFSPDDYCRAVHHDSSFQGCCNFFHPEGTFDFIDLIDEARFGLEAVQDVSVRQEKYDQLWPQIADAVGNTFIDFSLSVVVTGSEVEGYNAYPSRAGFLSYGLFAPHTGRLTYLTRAEEDLI